MIINAGPSFAEIKERLYLKVDAGAETARGWFITAGSGQAMAYQEKEREALNFKVDPTAETYPHLHLEAAMTGQTLDELADSIIAMAESWRQVSALIEAHRLNAKRVIAASPTPAEARAAALINWNAIFDTAGVSIPPRS